MERPQVHLFILEGRAEFLIRRDSLEKFMPWWKGQLIFVVPRGQTPNWLDVSNPRVKVVAQEDIVPDEANPTFNTNAIEPWLHTIPHLAKFSVFVHMNDDYFFGNYFWPWVSLQSILSLHSCLNINHPAGPPHAARRPHPQL